MNDYVTMTIIRALISDDLQYEHISPDYRDYLIAAAHIIDLLYCFLGVFKMKNSVLQ